MINKKSVKRYKKAGKNPEVEYYVCQVCGNTIEGEPPEKCPICGAPKSKF